jgi:hypothetical protein
MASSEEANLCEMQRKEQSKKQNDRAGPMAHASYYVISEF